MNNFKLTLWVILGLFLFSGNAAAYFETGTEGSLVLSIYNKDNNEVAIDLGHINDVIGLQNTIVAPTGSWNIDMFSGLTLADLDGAVRGSNYTTGSVQSYSLFFGLNSPDTPEIFSTKAFGIFNNANNLCLGTDQDFANGTSVALLPSSDDNSYYMRMVGKQADVKGRYAGLILPANEETEADMSLLETQGYVDLFLFNYLRVLSTDTTINPTAPVALIRMMADGSVVMNPTIQSNEIVVVASASPAVVNEGATVTLDGSQTHAELEDIPLTYTWTQIDQEGSPDVELTGDSDSPNWTFTAPSIDVEHVILVFVLTVKDTLGHVASSEQVSVTINKANVSSPPVAVASASQTSIVEIPGGTVPLTLTGSGSSDPDNDITSYMWTCEGPLNVVINNGDVTQPDRNITIPDVGFGGAELTFTLTVTDSQGNHATSIVIVTVSNVNRTPHIEITAPDTVGGGTEFILNALASTDPDGSVSSEFTSVIWTQLDVTDENRATLFDNTNPLAPVFLAPELGFNETLTLLFQLTVEDRGGITPYTQTVQVNVNFVNHQPLADIACTGLEICPEVYPVGSLLALDSDNSMDMDGQDDIVSRHWTLDLKPEGEQTTLDMTGGNISIATPSTPGNYRITLTVTDRSSSSHSVSYNFRVESESAHAPVAQIVSDSSVFETTALVLDGSSSSDQEGMEDIASAVWTFSQITHTDHPVTLSFVNSSPLAASFTAPMVSADTEVDITLTLTDRTGLQSSAVKRITIRNNNVPTAPSVNSPRYTSGSYSSTNGEVKTLYPILSVNNASDSDGQTLTYRFRLATNPSMTDIVAERTGIAQGTNITSWQVQSNDFVGSEHSLNDETLYFFQASASDGLSSENDRIWSEAAPFFVNLTNDAPTLPGVVYPQNFATVDSRKPYFLLTNATDKDQDTLVYEFQIFRYDGNIRGELVASTGTLPVAQGHVAVDDQGHPLSNPSHNETSWKPDVTLDDNATYLWRVRTQDVNSDEPSVDRNWRELVLTVNTENDSPLAPVVLSPAFKSRVMTRNPRLTVENVVDPDPSDSHTYYFEVVEKNSSCECDETLFPACEELGTCTIFQSPAVAEGTVDPELPGSQSLNLVFASDTLSGDSSDWEIPASGETTSWTVPMRYPGLPLSDNTLYCWRVRALDSALLAGSWVYSEFFVNLINDAPDAPEILQPQDLSRVIDSRPVLSVYPAFDPDGDSLSYRFELYDNPQSQSPIYAASVDACGWRIPEYLTEGMEYYWRVQASDQNTTGPWSSLVSFRYYSAYPPAPRTNSPVHGGVVNSLTPTLSILNPDDMDTENITYEFELYADRNLSSIVAYASINQGEGLTQWTISSASTHWASTYPAKKLLEDTDYYWRARTTVGSDQSSWTSTSRFTANTEAQVHDVVVEASQSVSASANTEQVISVTNTSSLIHGLRLVFPPESVTTDETLTIGYILELALPENFVKLFPALEFSPSGTLFDKEAELTLPWTPDVLPSGILENASSIDLYLFDDEAQAWELLHQIPIASITGDTLTFKIPHFSTYAVGITTKAAEPDPASDGGGSSGCFISSLF
ncbi:MAG: hypothetical protein WC799_12205 [Desulfobacteraceae bacterium]|jgi:hypothetical protein